MSSLLMIVVYLIVIAAVWWLITYVLDNLPFPPPIKQFGRVIATVIVVVMALYLLIGLIGGGGIDLPHLR